MIEDHYLMREIGFETPMLFKHYLNTRMREIMPKYNAMYASIPAYDPNMLTYKETSQSSSNGTNSSTFTKGAQTDSKGAQQDIQYGFDTPMNMGSISTDSPNHMSNAQRTDYGSRSDTSGSRTDTTQGSDSGSTSTTRQGTNQSVFQTIEQYRAFEFNIDEMIVKELEDLFMMIF